MLRKIARSRRMPLGVRSLLLLAALLCGPAWLRYSAKAQCNYSCGLGAYVGCTTYVDSAGADNGSGMCQVTICGASCYNSHGQICGVGPYIPPTCPPPLYQFESCWIACHGIPCGCDNFCSH